MTKQELIENYTMEQLAKMVIERDMKIQDVKFQLNRKQTEIKQIDEILNELFGLTHDVVKTPDKFREILREKADEYKTISDFLPTEPIKVADMLINAEGKEERVVNKIIQKEAIASIITNKIFTEKELKQIAQHLLVYCEANESKGEECQ